MGFSKKRRASIFVDGENLSIRIKAIKRKIGPRFSIREGSLDIKDIAFWHKLYSCPSFPSNGDSLYRVHYYTGAIGDDVKLREIRSSLQKTGIGTTYVAKKQKNNKNINDTTIVKSKTVDIQLTTDLLTSAINKQTDDIILVSADQDFTPVIKAAKRYGCRVYLAFPGLQCTTHDSFEDTKAIFKAMTLKETSDYFLSFDDILYDYEWLDFKNLSAEEMNSIVKTHIFPSLESAVLVSSLPKHHELTKNPQGEKSIDFNINNMQLCNFSWTGKITFTTRQPYSTLCIWPINTLQTRLEESAKQVLFELNSRM